MVKMESFAIPVAKNYAYTACKHFFTRASIIINETNILKNSLSKYKTKKEGYIEKKKYLSFTINFIVFSETYVS